MRFSNIIYWVSVTTKIEFVFSQIQGESQNLCSHAAYKFAFIKNTASPLVKVK